MVFVGLGVSMLGKFAQNAILLVVIIIIVAMIPLLPFSSSGEMAITVSFGAVTSVFFWVWLVNMNAKRKITVNLKEIDSFCKNRLKPCVDSILYNDESEKSKKAVYDTVNNNAAEMWHRIQTVEEYSRFFVIRYRNDIQQKISALEWILRVGSNADPFSLPEMREKIYTASSPVD